VIYFQFIAQCCRLLGRDPVKDGVEMLNDPNWHSCWEDGETPESAVAEYRRHLAEQGDGSSVGQNQGAVHEPVSPELPS
jgi:hypothetical protein